MGVKTAQPTFPKVIRTQEQYESYLEEIMHLMADGASLSQERSDRLELLSVIVESYENSRYPVEPPDPVEAILFRMQEKNLRKVDLIPFFGTSSRVSEVLSRKRPLTVQMIRELSRGLGISAETLLGLGRESSAANPAGSVDWSLFPYKEMSKRGWLDRLINKEPNSIEKLVEGFITDSGLQFGAASFRRTIVGEAESSATRYSLYAWLARVVHRARGMKKAVGKYKPSAISAGFLRDLAQLSWSDSGPLLAVEYLNRHGIVVVVEAHLKGTQLDGAALKDADGTPIIGLTLRYDRIDNFWFTLLHEVAHIWKHVDNNDAFLDDLDSSSEDRREAEANRIAKEALLPKLIWRRSEAYLRPSRDSVLQLSRELKIHPAIVAGRIRKDSGNYKILSDMVGQGSVRKLFPSSITEV